MTKNMISVAVAATLGLSAFAASAEDMYRGAWYALPGISFMNTDNDLDAHSGGGGFIKLGKEISPNLDLQGGFTYNRADEDTGIPGVGGHYKQKALGLDVLYMFSRDKFRPFLLAGVGVAHNDVDYSHFPELRNESRTSLMGNLGLGAQYLVTDKFGLQVDLRHQWSRSDAKAPGTGFDSEGTIGNTLLNIGAIFRFGEPAPVVAAAEPAPYVAPEPAPVAAAPAPVEPMAPVPACVTKTETVTLEAEKLFAFNKSDITPQGKVDLDAVVAKINARPSLELVMVEGHSDRIGSEDYNLKLSNLRANHVRDYLLSQGVNESRVQAVGKGESEPVVACDGVKNRKALIECLQPNRRVVITSHGLVDSSCKP